MLQINGIHNEYHARLVVPCPQLLLLHILHHLKILPALAHGFGLPAHLIVAGAAAELLDLEAPLRALDDG